jgi:hypothetical protein
LGFYKTPHLADIELVTSQLLNTGKSFRFYEQLAFLMNCHTTNLSLAKYGMVS